VQPQASSNSLLEALLAFADDLVQCKDVPAITVAAGSLLIGLEEVARTLEVLSHDDF
jgi:hypothetical protein